MLKRHTHLPVIVDPSHGTGLAWMVPSMACGGCRRRRGRIADRGARPSGAGPERRRAGADVRGVRWRDDPDWRRGVGRRTEPRVKSFLAAAAVIVLALAGAAQDAGRQSPFESTAAPEVKNRIDDIVFAALKKQGIRPARLSSDAVFVRRVYLDVIGTLPTADEARAFIEDRDANKRQRAHRPAARARGVRRLLGDEVVRRAAGEVGVPDQPVAERRAGVPPLDPRPPSATTCPYDRFARELLTASGSNFRVRAGELLPRRPEPRAAGHRARRWR